MYKQQEVDEVIKQAQSGDKRAIEYLIGQNMDIVYAKAKYFFIKGLDKDDVIQEGRVGLYKAVRDYKIDRRASFRGFSQLCVHRQLVSAIKKANRQKHIPLNTSTSLDKTIDYDDSSGRSFNEILPDKDKNLEEDFIYREVLKVIFNDIEKELTTLELEVFFQYLDSKSYKEKYTLPGLNVKTKNKTLQISKKKINNTNCNYNLKDLVG